MTQWHKRVTVNMTVVHSFPYGNEIVFINIVMSLCSQGKIQQVNASKTEESERTECFDIRFPMPAVEGVSTSGLPFRSLFC